MYLWLSGLRIPPRLLDWKRKTNKAFIMRAKLLIVVLVILLIAPACNKEEFPDRETLVGTWVVKDGPSYAYLEFTEWRVTIVNGSTAQYQYSPLASTMYLYPNKYGNPDKFSTHSIYYNKKKNELRIWNILKDYADGSGFTTFKRQ